jgi:hypothetical protein
VANLNAACVALASILGEWLGEGEVDYPTIDGPRRYRQQITIDHDGRPFLSHEARSWLLDADGNVVRPAAREVGWWRPQPDGTLEFLLAHSSGIVEIFYGGAIAENSWELRTETVVRTHAAKDVESALRRYVVTAGGLRVSEERAMVGQALLPHTSSLLSLTNEPQ